MQHKKQQVIPAISFIAVLLLLASCKKESVVTPPVPPIMQYTDLHDEEVVDMNRKYIDLDADGRSDFFFEVVPVADPLLQRMRLQFYAYSRTHTSLLNADPDQTPALQIDEPIRASVPGYTWWEVSGPVLAEEITPENGNAYWHGSWKNAVRNYLPVRVRKGNKHYFGWIEMTLDKDARKLILHKAGLSTEGDKAVKAGR